MFKKYEKKYTFFNKLKTTLCKRVLKPSNLQIDLHRKAYQKKSIQKFQKKHQLKISRKSVQRSSHRDASNLVKKI